MCGISAIFAYGSKAPPVDAAELARISGRMSDRGPDGAGEWFSMDRRVGMAHRRLAILDLSENGAQPMATADGSVIVSFNGEIYNYRELRRELESRGAIFRSETDTEVLLHLYLDRGEEMVKDLRGMYAFTIWNQRKRRMFIARDPFGIKPLYYADDGATLRVASQVKALLAGGHIQRRPSPAGHVGFLVWGSVPEPHTMYRDIHAVPAGACLSIGVDGLRQVSNRDAIHKILTGTAARPGDDGLFRSALTDSVRRHLVSDVPVGIFLSAGIDSTTVAALASGSGGALRTVTLGFEEFRGTPDDETVIAEKAAVRLGAQHQTVWVSRGEFARHMERILDAMDQPSVDGVNTYFVSHAAAQASLKVALSGLGGDEFLGGYPSFTDVPRMASLLRPLHSLSPLGRGLRVLASPLLGRMTSPKYASLLEFGTSFAGAYLLRRGLFMPWELRQLMDPAFAAEGWEALQTLASLERDLAGLPTDRLKVTALEMGWYMRNQLLRDADWASMAHSIELRVPLVDIELLRCLAPMLAGDTPPGKRAMAQVAGDRVPSEIGGRRKTGFGTPISHWLAERRGGAAGNQVRGLRGWARQVYALYGEESVQSREALAA